MTTPPIRRCVPWVLQSVAVAVILHASGSHEASLDGTRPVILQTDHNYSEWSNFQDNNDLDEGLGPANLGDVDVVSGRADSVSFEDYLGAVDSNGGSTRVKRAAGHTLDAANFDLVEIASHTHGSTIMEIGDSYTFKGTIDLPGIDVSDKADLKIEIFVIDPNDGLTGFHICQAHVTHRGTQLKAIQPTNPWYEDQKKTNYPSVVEKTTILYENLHTENSTDASGDTNKIEFQFQAVMVNTADLNPGTTYYITAGVEYGLDEYIWIGQAEVTSAATFATTAYASDVSITGSPPATLKKGYGTLFTVEAILTDPSDEVEFGVFQPLGYNDLFHFGHITYEVGNAYACSGDADLWVEKYVDSPTGLSVNNASVFHPFLINRESPSQDLTDLSNKITFKVPVHLMNIDHVTKDLKRDIAFALRVGTSKLWTALHEVTIEDHTAPTGATAPTHVSTALHNNVTTAGQVRAGNSAVFRVEVDITSAWGKFDVAITGDSSKDIHVANVKIADGGLVSYFPPNFAVESRSGDTLTLAFGDVNNVADSGTTRVVLEVSFAVGAGATPQTVTSLTSSTIGTTTVGPFDFEIIANPTPADITVSASDFDFGDDLYTHGQGALEFLVTVPSGAGNDDIVFEAIPDSDQTEWSLRLCEVRVHAVGEALPCTDAAATSAVNYTKSDDAIRPFNDFGILEIGRVCPLNYPDDETHSNQFKISMFYELPPQSGVDSGETAVISGGLRQAESTIWVASKTFTANGNTFSGANIQTGITGGSVEPLFTVYPYVSTKDLPTSTFDKLQGFFIQYLLKPQPVTRGDYKLTITPPAGAKVCRVVITHIGKNMPCAEPPGATVTGYENTEIVYDDGGTAPRTCGKDAVVKFYGLTNWGRDDFVSDLTPDENSVQVLAFMQLCAAAPTGVAAVAVTSEIAYGASGTQSNTFDVDVSANTVTPDTTSSIASVQYKSLVGPDDKLFLEAAKIMQFKVEVPDEYFGSLALTLSFNDDDKYVLDFCGMEIVDIGANLPCLHPTDGVTHSPTMSTVTLDPEETHLKSLTLDIPDFCYTKYEDSLEARTITVEAVVRPRNNIPVTTSLGFVFTATPAGGATKKFEFSFALEVATPGASDVPTDALEPGDVSVAPDAANDAEILMHTAEKTWIPFTVSFPPEKTVKMEASVLLPSNDGKAILHASDIRFGTSPGKNILCTNEHTDLRRSYDPVAFEKTSNISTFMQVDSVTVDMGYVANPGWSLRQNVHTATDDQFNVDVEVQLSDQALTAHDATFDVHFAVQFGDIIVVAEQVVKVVRPDPNITPGPATRQQELGEIDVNVEQTDPTKIYDRNEKVEFHGIISHLNTSRAEGYPASVTVVSPSYLTFEAAQAVVTNYTTVTGDMEVKDKDDAVVAADQDGVFSFEFPGGITYADVIALNFTMTVDPNGQRPKGSPDETATVVFIPSCEQQVIDSYPANAGDKTTCGTHQAVTVEVKGSTCEDVFTFADCQIRASSVISDAKNPPQFAITTTNAWSPALRTGEIWNNWIEFDLLTVAKITAIKVGNSANIGGETFRPPEEIMIQVSNSAGMGFEDVEKMTPGPATHTLSSTATGRYVRLRLLRAGDVTNDAVYPIGVGGVEIKGCYPNDFSPPAVPATCPGNTPASDDANVYRHFAVDDENNVVYFCDVEPYSYSSADINPVRCFGNNRAEGNGYVWHELPRFVRRIHGYSTVKKRVFFEGTDSGSFFSSLDGQTIELDEAPSGLVTGAKPVPGDTESNVGEVIWTGALTEYKAKFDGLYSNSDLLVQWTTCCTTDPNA